MSCEKNRLPSVLLFKSDRSKGYAVSENKVKEQIVRVIRLLESGETNRDIIQGKLDEMSFAINGLEEEFEENDSEIETVERQHRGCGWICLRLVWD